MSTLNELQKHYALLLDIGSPWEVKTVELKLSEKKVKIERPAKLTPKDWAKSQGKPSEPS